MGTTILENVKDLKLLCRRKYQNLENPLLFLIILSKLSKNMHFSFDGNTFFMFLNLFKHDSYHISSLDLLFKCNLMNVILCSDNEIIKIIINPILYNCG